MGMMAQTTDGERTPCAVMVASPLWPLQAAEPDEDRLREDRRTANDDAHAGAVTG
jgi:hypothetical protein